MLVLEKMRELKFITKEEYEEAAEEELDFTHGKGTDTKVSAGKAQSYFADHIFEEAKKDLMEKFE